MPTIDEILRERLPRLRAALRVKGAEGPSSGRTREAWLFPRVVVKLPLCEQGVGDNLSEIDQFKRGVGSDLARCRRLQVLGVPLVVMERLSPGDPASIPDWADFIDCRQVGVDRKGRWKAYDYA